VHDATVKDESIKKILSIKPKSFEDAIRDSLEERNRTRNTTLPMKERTSRMVNNRILIGSLFLMAAFGLTYYFLGSRQDILQPQWLALSVVWYLGIAFSIYFVRYGTRLGAFSAGVLGWIMLAFWLLDGFYIVSGNLAISSSNPDLPMNVRNFIGAVVAALVIISSHNVFHKIVP
jgi:hypothetical protein